MFFFKQKTAYAMRITDWSSDVCSSDLILISVASKNAHDDAMERLRAFGRDQYALYPAIGWSAKSESVRQVSERLGIGLDSIIFVDDSPFERDEVSRSLPGVDVLPERDRKSVV